MLIGVVLVAYVGATCLTMLGLGLAAWEFKGC
jgi:hypothetical protein